MEKGGKGISIVLILALVAIGGLFLWAWNKSKQPGSTGGIFGQIGGLWSGASGFTQNVTDASMKTGESIGGGVKSGVKGGIGIGDDVLHAGGNANPLNWF